MTTATQTKPVTKTTPKPKTTPTKTTPVKTTPVKTKAKPLSWAERLAAMPPEEAKAVRAKAAEASRISKAKARGTTPTLARAMRLKARLATNIERTEFLTAERAKIEAELGEIEAQLTEQATEAKPAKPAKPANPVKEGASDV